MSPRSSFYVDDQPITIPGVRWVTDAQQLHGPQNISMAQVTLPGRDGELPIPSTRTVGASEWSLSVAVQGDSYADFMARKTELERLLSPRGRLVELREDMKDKDGFAVETVRARAYLTGSSVAGPWEGDVDGADLVYNFRIPSGFWTSDAVTASYTTPGTYTLNAARGGSAPQYEVTVTLETSGGVDFGISNPDTGEAYLRFEDPENPAGRISDIDVNTVSSTFRATPLPIRNSNQLRVGEELFFIAPDGRIRIDRMTGVTRATITTRKAYY